MQEQLKARNFEEAEKTADSILKMMGVSAQSTAQNEAKTEALTLLERCLSRFRKFRRSCLHGPRTPA